MLLNQSGCLPVTGKLFTSVCLLVLLSTWTAIIQAQNDNAGSVAQTGITGDLPLLDAGTALKLARKWIDEGQPQQAFELLRHVMQAAKEEGDIDTTNIRFLAAQALLKMGRPAHAAVILGQTGRGETGVEPGTPGLCRDTVQTRP